MEAKQPVDKSARPSRIALGKMARLLKDLAVNPSVDGICAGAVTLLKEVFGFPYIEVWEVDPHSGCIQVRFCEASESQKLQGYIGQVGDGILGHVAQTGKTLLVRNAQDDPRFIPFLEGSTTEVASPVLVDGRVRFILNIECTSPEEVEDLDIGLLDTLAGILGTGFKLVEEMESREMLSRRLREERNTAQELAEALRKENIYLKEDRGEKIVFENMIGVSPSMQDLFRSMEAVKNTKATVLIQGRTGVGKELVARTLHRIGPRRSDPFVVVNAANLQTQIFESELFGHVKGAFSGADRDRKGLAAAANGGTLFLDEVGELSLENQAKFLRFLDHHEIRPVGSNRTSTVDVHIIAATNRDLETEVRNQNFRGDLYYRLKAIQLHVPSLKERREDLPLLILHFLETFSIRDRKRIPGITEEAMDRLRIHPWEGNVRELKNEMERLVALTPEGEKVRAAVLSPSILPAAPPPGRAGMGTLIGEAHREDERALVSRVIGETGWNVTRAAQILGMSRVGLTKKLKRLGLKRPS